MVLVRNGENVTLLVVELEDVEVDVIVCVAVDAVDVLVFEDVDEAVVAVVVEEFVVDEVVEVVAVVLCTRFPQHAKVSP